MLLRQYRGEDLDEHVAILSQWEVTKWLSTNIPFPYNREEGEHFIEAVITDFEKGEKVCFSIIDKRTMRHMGGLKFFALNCDECEIGYWLGTDFWSKGFATEMLNAAIHWLESEGVVKKLVAQTAAKNIGSRKLLEAKGFVHKGTPPVEHARQGYGDGCSEYYERVLYKEIRNE